MTNKTKHSDGKVNGTTYRDGWCECAHAKVYHDRGQYACYHGVLVDRDGDCDCRRFRPPVDGSLP